MNWPPDIKPVTDYLDVSAAIPFTVLCSQTLFGSERMLSELFTQKTTLSLGLNVAVVFIKNYMKGNLIRLSLLCPVSLSVYRFSSLRVIKT